MIPLSDKELKEIIPMDYALLRVYPGRSGLVPFGGNILDLDEIKGEIKRYLDSGNAAPTEAEIAEAMELIVSGAFAKSCDDLKRSERERTN